jgi:hypothetical protein
MAEPGVPGAALAVVADVARCGHSGIRACFGFRISGFKFAALRTAVAAFLKNQMRR